MRFTYYTALQAPGVRKPPGLPVKPMIDELMERVQFLVLTGSLSSYNTTQTG